MIAGIDGGGSVTTLIVEQDDGSREEYKYGPFNINSIGEEAFRDLLGEMVPVLRGADAVCFGAAGYSNIVLKRIIGAAMDEAGVRRWKLTGDHEIALEGALGGKDGLVLIAGTGSICIGRRGEETARAGGWGHLIGDEGSGYAVARDALSAVSREMDGYGEPTLIRTVLRERYGLSSREGIIGYVYSGDKSAVASLSGVVEKAAVSGDAVASRILSDNAKKLSALAGSVSGNLGLDDCPVALMGGFMMNSTLYREMVIRELEGCHLRPVSPRNTPQEGALSVARGLSLN